MLIFNKILLFRKLILAWLIFGLSLLLTFSSFNVRAEQQDRMIRPVSPFTLSFSPSLYNGFNISCNGGADGVIDMTINGGTPPFVISWSNGDTLEDIDSLFAGTYVVMVTDSDGTSFTDSVTLIAPDAIGISGTVINDSCFGGTNGAIDITVTNGAGGFSYSWSNLEITEDIINFLKLPK